MPGKLVQVATETVTSPVAQVDLIGTTDNNIYMVAYENVVPATDAVKLQVRFLASSTPNSTSNYDRAQYVINSAGSPTDQGAQNQSAIESLDQGGTATEESLNGIHYFYNLNNASEYSIMQYHGVALSSVSQLNSRVGGGILTVAEAHNGIRYFFASSSNIASGTFTLYKVI